MKKFIKIIIAALLLTGCDATPKNTEDGWLETERFIIVEKYHHNSTSDFYVFMDKETGVEYLFWVGIDGRGSITPLYNNDGALITYGGK